MDLDEAARRADQLPFVRPFRPAFWLRGAHAQSIWSPLFRRRRPLAYEPRWLATPDDDRLRLQVLAGKRAEPTVLMLHGLEGTASSNYMLGQGLLLQRLGWTVAALEFRSCSGELNRARRLYHSGETTDLDFVVRHLLRLRQGPLFISGVSLGGNVLSKWLGDLGEEVPARVLGCAAISAPYDLVASGPVIDRALGGVYVRRFLRTLIPKALAKEQQFPGCMDAEAVRNSRNFEQFDTHATAALHGYEDAWDYWEKVSCGPRLDKIRVPHLLIGAQDDPFHPPESTPLEAVERNPLLWGAFPKKGGHVGFVGGWPGRTTHWAEEAAVGFFQWLLEASPADRATLPLGR